MRVCVYKILSKCSILVINFFKLGLVAMLLCKLPVYPSVRNAMGKMRFSRLLFKTKLPIFFSTGIQLSIYFVLLSFVISTKDSFFLHFFLTFHKIFLCLFLSCKFKYRQLVLGAHLDNFEIWINYFHSFYGK